MHAAPIDRRDFLQRTAILGTMLPLMGYPFLAKHLGGRYQPIENDFAGSSLKIETGGEWMPGITK